MIKLILSCLFVLAVVITPSLAQDPAAAQGTVAGLDNGTQVSPAASTALAAYTKWRTDTLLNYAQGVLTPHYAVAILAQRMDDSTAQIEILLAADMKHYVISIKPVMLTRNASGETTTTPAGNVVTFDQKAGDKLNNGPEATRLGQTSTLVPINKSVQALEVTWTPKNDNKDDFANTCIVTLSKEPAVVVNGYVIGAPVK